MSSSPSLHFGRYEIRSELGRGGMATVFHAYDPSFERDVAIKVLPPAFLHDPQLRARFEREAKMIASLEHPAIVPVYDFGEEGGQPYIVMRYMAGGSLADRLQQGALSLEETSRVISRLSPALDAAHARGIVHRDLKPGNVLFDQYGNAFLSDFGIARLQQQDSATLTGSAIVGTPAFMSPEQIQGEKTIDGRSDIYALGVLVYQMLTGQAPYQADTPAKVMLMHLLEPVPHVLDARSDLPAGCDQVIQKAMAKSPDDRYQTAGEMAAALEAALRGQLIAPTLRESAGSDATVLSNATIVAAPHPQPSEMAPLSGAGAAGGAMVAVSAAGETMAAKPKPAVVVAVEPRRRPLWPLLAVLGVGGVIILMVVIGLGVLASRGGGPLASLAGGGPRQTATGSLPAGGTEARPSMTATALPLVGGAVTSTATATPTPQPTETPAPTPTETASPTPKAPIIGGADKIAFIKDKEIWVANLDGSDLLQLTQDGTVKTSLQWTPDGQAITYITAKCIELVRLADRQVEQITCFNYADSLKQFEASRDGQKAAITLDNQLYIVPYDLELLKQATTHSQLGGLAECKDFAPYARNFITQVRWSGDSKVIAAKLIANLGNGIQGNIIQLFHVDACIPNPRALDNFPPPRFDMDGYDKNPFIQTYTWDGGALFALTSQVRNEGFGHLYIYHTEMKKVYPKVDPVGGQCCYRDPVFSPDGSYLAFAFQDRSAGVNSTTQIYYIPYGSIGSQASYTPLPLPEITDPKEKPQIVLRAAR